MKIKFLSLFFVFFMSKQIHAEQIFTDNFENHLIWEYIADDVMGGVSKGSVVYMDSDKGKVALLSGKVSTENNGGFIQIRRDLSNVKLDKAKFIKIVAKGNNHKYFIHIRTTGTFLPWQYYSAVFFVNDEYRDFIIPISDFTKSGSFIAQKVNTKSIKSIGLVAFGRDHKAELYIKEIAFID